MWVESIRVPHTPNRAKNQTADGKRLAAKLIAQAPICDEPNGDTQAPNDRE
jgi:hypothetical protein